MGTDSESRLRKDVSTLTVDFIKAVVEQYKNNQLKFATENLRMDDARSIWFDLPTLKAFIADVENQARIQNPDITDADLGVRMYYGAYPENMENPDVDKEYRKRHTLVMIPTKKEKNESGEVYNQDFSPVDSGASNERLALTAQNALAQNHGKLSPPLATLGELY